MELTLDEAINHLDETLEDDSRVWSCEECKQEHMQLREWLIELKGLREAQEPRVMTLEEWKNLPEPKDGECLCYEINDGRLQAMLVKTFVGCENLYGKVFRVWTSRPSDEKKGEVKW